MLDDGIYHVKGLLPHNIVVLERNLFPFNTTYGKPEADQVAFLQRLTPQLYDVIVIGNNRGVGVLKAQLIPQSLRERVVIVWNLKPDDHDTAPYRELGYRHFSSRDSLEYYLETNGLV